MSNPAFDDLASQPGRHGQEEDTHHECEVNSGSQRLTSETIHADDELVKKHSDRHLHSEEFRFMSFSSLSH
jgi:hypothetical protein